MNAPLLPAVLRTAAPEPSEPPTARSAQSYLWEGRFGAMLIEVKGGVVYVNGQRVEPFAPPRARE